MMHILSFYFLIASSALRLDWPAGSKKKGPKTSRDDISAKKEPTVPKAVCTNKFMSMSGPLHSHLKIQRTNYPGFNPAIAKIPQDVASQLHKDAFFVLATKLSHNQCANFCYDNEKTHWSLWKTENTYASAISILDRNLNVILGPVTVGGGEDMRLLAVGDILLADYHYKGANWEVRQLHLGINGGAFSAALGAITFGDMKDQTPNFHGQNIGLVARNESLYGIWWMTETSVKETRQITRDGRSKIVNFGKELTQAAPAEVHNSIHPVWIPELNKYLGAAHYGRAAWGTHGIKYASEYVQYMALFDPEPPFKMVKRSPDFCFPTLKAEHSGTCEVIQYVTAITRNPQDPNELLISFGVNDCESMLARIPLKTVLHSMFDSDFSSEIGTKTFFRVPNGEADPFSAHHNVSKSDM